MEDRDWALHDMYAAFEDGRKAEAGGDTGSYTVSVSHMEWGAQELSARSSISSMW